MYGRHISLKKTFNLTLRECHEFYGVKSFQIVMKSPKSKGMCKITDEDADETKKYVEENDLYVVAHSGYLFNIARDPATNDYAVKTARDDLVNIARIGGRGAVFHVGKHIGQGVDIGVEHMYINVLNILMATMDYPESIFILETSAGQGTELLTKLKELAEFRARFSPDEQKRIRFCLDTCHMFAAGYNLSTQEQVNAFEREVADTIGWENVELFHFNDSKDKCGARKDRHEKIGLGHIGTEGMKGMAALAGKYKIPLILETPILKTDTRDDLKAEVYEVAPWYDGEDTLEA